MGRKRIVGEILNVGLPEGTLERMKNVMLKGESQASLARSMILNEIERREAGDFKPSERQLLSDYLFREGGIGELLAEVARIMESSEFRQKFEAPDPARKSAGVTVQVDFGRKKSANE